jgi:hypothetical protein
MPTPADLDERIAALWAAAEDTVSAAWPDNWRTLAPGEEVLQGIWTHFDLGGYSKTTDGPIVAATMTRPPTDLVAMLADFLK